MPEERWNGGVSADSLYAESLGMAPISPPRSPARYSDINGEEIHRDMTALCDLAQESRRRGDTLWGRIAGFGSERQAAELVARKFEEFGLEEVRIEDVPRGPQWWPVKWELTLIGDPAYGEATRDYTFTSAFPAAGSPSTPTEGIEAELVYVGMGRRVDWADRDLDGKVAVLYSSVPHSTFRHSGRGVPAGLVEAGAIGVITIVGVPGNVLSMLQGTGAADTTCFTLGGADGKFLEDVIARVGKDRKPRIRMKLKAEYRDGLKTQNTIGVVHGRGDEYVIVSAHLDSYFDGASDNASGIATMIALAKHYARSDRAARDRTLVFIGTGAHHARSVGVSHFVSTHATIARNTVLDLNCEHTAAILVRSGSGQNLTTANTESPKSVGVSNMSPLLVELLGESLNRFGVVSSSRITSSTPGDAGRYVRAGIPVVQLIESNYWYHTSGDTPATITPSGLERTARAYADFLDKVDTFTREQLERNAQHNPRRRSGREGSVSSN